MKTILITGSAGFIFSNFIRKALYSKSDYRFISVDLCLGPQAMNNVYVNKGHTMYVADIADRHVMDVIFETERPEIVLHGAAESFVDSSIDSARPFIHSNVLGTQNIIDACVRWNVEKLIYVSTDEVYGHLTGETDKSWTEESPLAPRNPYSASKASGELLVRAAGLTHGLRYNITRSCNNYGPRQQTRNLIPKIITNIMASKPVPIYGQGKQSREWIFVEDHCNAIMTILKDGKDDETYNISSGHEFSNIEVFHQLCNALETGHDLLTFVEDRKGHDYRYSVDATKLRNLGWKPGYKFKHGLDLCINWYKNNKWFWNKP